MTTFPMRQRMEMTSMLLFMIVDDVNDHDENVLLLFN